MKDFPLVNCIAGMSGIISRIDQNANLSSRLQELGLVPGEWIRVVKSGNPLLLQVGDTRLCLRMDDLKGVSMLPLSSEEGVQISADVHSPIQTEFSPLHPALAPIGFNKQQ